MLLQKGGEARYASAADLIGKCFDKVSREQKPYFRALQEMVRGYDLWDRFQHREAKEKLYKSRDTLMVYSSASHRNEDNALVAKVLTNLEFLERFLSIEKPSVLYFYDLLANAKRRADLERKFDDAVARLYRAIETLAQARLKERGIETSDIKVYQIPESVRQEYVSKYRDAKDLKIRIPLLVALRLLREYGDELAENFFRVYDKEITGLVV